LYYYNYDSQTFVLYEDKVQLPEKPLGDVVIQGEVMLQYKALYAASTNEAIYEVLFWDTHTGNSKLYFFDHDEKQFKSYPQQEQLPNLPLKKYYQGDIMLDYSLVEIRGQARVNREVLVWEIDKGNSLLYYKDETSGVFKTYRTTTQLPDDMPENFRGNIMMDYSALHVLSEDKTYYEVLVWDDKTGQSLLYYYDYKVHRFVLYDAEEATSGIPLAEVGFMGRGQASGAKENNKQFYAYNGSAQLPNDLDERLAPVGRVMADYSAVYVSSSDRTYYEVLFWDVATGKSCLYYYNYANSYFKAYESSAQFDAPDFGDRDGAEIMVDYTVTYSESADNITYEALFWDVNTGESVIYYYDFEEKTFLHYNNNAGIPEKPLE